MGWLALTGFLSSVTQVVLLREANVAFYGVELVYLLAIGIWLFWTGIGAACDRGSAVPPALAAVALLVASLGVLLPADVAFLRASRELAGGVTGAYLPFARQLAVLVAALLPVGVLLGLLFQWTARRAVSHGLSLASAYAIESGGALAGGAATVVWTRAHGSTFGLAMFATGCCVLACAVASRRTTRAVRVAGAIVGVTALGLVGRMDAVDQRMTRWSHPFLVESRDSPYGRITVTRAAEQVSVFENDALAFETGGTDAELLAHVAALAHPSPLRMLLLGGGPEGVARELLQHRPDRLDIVELNPVLLEMVRRHVPAALPPPDSPGTRLFVVEPRKFLRGAQSYDLIVVSSPEPDSGQANRFFTTEFFAQCAARLDQRGLLAFRLRTAENFWTPAQALRFASVHRSLVESFAHIVVLPGAVNVVLASRAPLPTAAAPLVERFLARGIRARLVHPAYLEYLFSSDRRQEIETILARTGAPANTDTEPVCYRYALMLWVGRFWPALAGVDPRAPWATRAGWQAGLVAVIVVLAFLWAGRRRAAHARAVYVGLVALAGMLLEGVVLMHYQVTQGVMFQDIGVLVAAFMAGLAAGTWALARAQHSWRSLRGAGYVVAGLLGGAAGGLAGLVELSAAPTLATASLALVVTGGFVGAGFGWASLRAGADQRGAIAPLYAADLVGGSVGAVVGGLLLIPLLGLTATALVAGVLALLAVVLA